ncbi:MAG: hypothetical protein GY851_32615 [bacterium]|nr:hypothetical protein [bacterium]
MGASSLSGLQQPLPFQSLFAHAGKPGRRSGPALPALLNSHGAANALMGKKGAGDDAPAVGFNDEQAINESFEAMVYQSKMQRVAMSLKFSEAAAQVAVAGDGEDGAAEFQAQAQQLEFEFFSETRTEEMVRFQQRTETIGNEMDPVRRETYMEASQRVSTRFSMSMTISGAALSGYTKASEGLPEADDASFDQFQGFVDDALAQADEMMEEVFKLLGDFFNSDQDFETRFNQFVEGLNNLDLMGGFGGVPAAGQSTGAAAQTQSFQFSMQLEFEFEYTEIVQVQEGTVQESDPIIFDLDGDGYELTSHNNGARFDILGNGQAANTAFVTGGDAFLAMDRNGNGLIDSGRELFGDQRGAANGFEELRKLDSNGDGRINSKDNDFDKLILFKDNGNGLTEEGELASLAESGISEIQLGYSNVRQVAMGGNRIEQIASFLRNDGTRGGAADAILNFTV